MFYYALLSLTVIAACATGIDDRSWAAAKVAFQWDMSPAAEPASRQAAEMSLKRAHQLRTANPHATFGLTPLSILSEEQYARRYANSGAKIQEGRDLYAAGKLPHLRMYDPVKTSGNSTLPVNVDWRDHGAVTPVKNQGTCGSCWSFSTTGNIEGQWFLAGNTLTSFSEQNFVSCDHLLSFGCDGGFSWMAYSWAVSQQNGTIFTESSYPYVSANGTVPECDTSRAVAGGKIIGGKLLSPFDAYSMKYFIAHEGPLSVAVDATSVWQDYTSGVVTSCTGLLPNHEVLIVGYGVQEVNATSSIEYWIIKNSWGVSWGENGYMRLELGKNLCLVETLANSADVVRK